MDIPLSGHLLSDDEPWFEFTISPPANLPYELHFQVIDVPHVDRIDRRLLDYHVRLLVSELTPEDPSDWPAFVVDWQEQPQQQWRLWRLWVRYHDAPMIGELQYVSGYGWRRSIVPTGFRASRPLRSMRKRHAASTSCCSGFDGQAIHGAGEHLLTHERSLSGNSERPKRSCAADGEDWSSVPSRIRWGSPPVRSTTI
jgi:hypothetical protein